MKQHHNKKLMSLSVLIAILLVLYLPTRGLAQKEWPTQIPFGFQIKEKVRCECSGFNLRFKPLVWGLPAPLPPLPLNEDERFTGGSLATEPFHLPIPFFPTDEYSYQGIEELEWVLGMTHKFPLFVPCVNLVFGWLGPRCKDEWGWLWRMIGSARSPDLRGEPFQ